MINPADGQPDPGLAIPSPNLRVPHQRISEKDLANIREPDDFNPDELLFPDDRWPRGRPEWVVVVDQLRDWRLGQPPSLAELLERGCNRGRDPEPDLEAEP